MGKPKLECGCDLCVICLLGACCQSLNYDAAAVEELEQVRQQEAAQVRSAKEAVEVLAAQLSALDFTYRYAAAFSHGHSCRNQL